MRFTRTREHAADERQQTGDRKEELVSGFTPGLRLPRADLEIAESSGDKSLFPISSLSELTASEMDVNAFSDHRVYAYHRVLVERDTEWLTTESRAIAPARPRMPDRFYRSRYPGSDWSLTISLFHCC